MKFRAAHKSFRPMAMVSTFVLVAACDSTQLSDTNGVTYQQSPVAVSNMIQIKAAASPPASDENLLTNPAFVDPLGEIPGWSACNNEDNIGRVYSGASIYATVAGGDCVQQGVEIDAGREMTLSCDARAYDRGNGGWSGLGLSFYDSNWGYISEPDAAVVGVGDGFVNFSVTGNAPATASFVGAWFYTETGGELANCVLSYGDDDPVEEGKQVYQRTYVLAKNRFGSPLDGLVGDVVPDYGGGYQNRDRFILEGSDNSDLTRDAGFRIAQDGTYLYPSVAKNSGPEPLRCFYSGI